MQAQTSRKNSSEILLLCLNPACPTPSERCLDSRSLRTHPSDCSRHYFSVDDVLERKWGELPDYPSDPLGREVRGRINGGEGAEGQSRPYLTRLIDTLKQKLIKIVDTFSTQLHEHLPSSQLQQLYLSTYSLQSVAKYIRQDCTPAFITKTINGNFSKLQYGELKEVNEKIGKIGELCSMVEAGVRGQLKGLVEAVAGMGGRDGKEKYAGQSYRVEEGRLKPKIQLGLLKSKFISSSKIECKQGRISFPKLDNIASFLPWIYTDKGWNSGVHELRLTSLKFPSVSNCGVCVLEEHDIDTYPYHWFKSLYSKDGKNFTLVPLASDTQARMQQKPTSTLTTSQIEHIIGQTSQLILRLELTTTKPQAILTNAQRNCTYVCQLVEGKRYRMGLYGSGWLVQINQLW